MNILKHLKYQLFPFLQFKEKNLSIVKKLYIGLNTLMMVIVILFIGAYMFSKFFYSYSLVTKNITIYANQDILKKKKFIKAIDNAKIQLKTSTLYRDDYRTKIYMVDNILYYNFMVTPWHMNTVATNLFDSIHIHKRYIEVFTDKYEYLSQTIVHEIIHTFQATKYGGWLRSFLIPYWVKEGYARYIEEYKIVKEKPKEFLIKNGVKKNYTLFALMVKHAIEKMHKTVDELHEGKVDYDEVLHSLLKEYNITKEGK